MIDKIKYLILTLLILILYYLMSYLNNLNYQNENFTNNKPTISLCIPCYPPDTHELDKLMDSVRKLTVKPDQIIIGHSEINETEARKIEKKFSDLSVQVISSPNKQYQAKNRNMAAEHNTCDYISFMDADDIMVPFRFDILKNTIKDYKPKAILHSYYNNKLPNEPTREIKEVIDGVKIYDILERTKTLQITDYIVHHAHITVHKDTFKNVKQNTSDEYYRKEDSKYVRDIVKFYGRKKDTMIFLDIPLSVYIP